MALQSGMPLGCYPSETITYVCRRSQPRNLLYVFFVTRPTLMFLRLLNWHLRDAPILLTGYDPEGD